MATTLVKAVPQAVAEDCMFYITIRVCARRALNTLI